MDVYMGFCCCFLRNDISWENILENRAWYICSHSLVIFTSKLYFTDRNIKRLFFYCKITILTDKLNSFYSATCRKISLYMKTHVWLFHYGTGLEISSKYNSNQKFSLNIPKICHNLSFLKKIKYLVHSMFICCNLKMKRFVHNALISFNLFHIFFKCPVFTLNTENSRKH